MDRIAQYYFNLDTMARFLPDLWQGFLITLQMAVLVVIFGISLGLVLALVRAFRIRPVNYLMVFLVDVFRAIPPLVVIICCYFALPYAGVRFSPFTATVLSLIAVLAAFAEEIFWAGITSVEAGQWEAGRATGLSFKQTLVWIVVPQGVRLAIPPLTNRTVAITKQTALGSAVAVPEILSQASSAQSMAANPSPLTLGALMYILLFLPFVLFSRWVERRYGWAK